MSKLEDINTSEEFKSFTREIFLTMIKELSDLQYQVMSNYKNNPAIPFDYYGLMLREIDAKIQCKMEAYRRLTNEELDLQSLNLSI